MPSPTSPNAPKRSVPTFGTGLLVAVAVAMSLLLLWAYWCRFPSYTWNDMRLAPALAWLRGIPVYPTATEGVVNTWIYGPLPLVLLLPAALASTAVGAVKVAGFLNLLPTVGAIALVGSLWPVNGAVGARPARVLAIALTGVLWPGYAYAFFQCDSLAVGLGLVGSLLLVRSNGQGRAAWWAAAAAAGALACKQIAVGIPLAQFLWFLMVAGPVAALRHVGRLAICGLALGVLAVATFGIEPLRFVLLEIPSRIPWLEDPGAQLYAFRYHLFFQIVVPIGIMIVWRHRFWGREAPLLLPALNWLSCLPLGLVAILKEGGSMNSVYSLPLWMPPVATAALVHPIASSHLRRWRPALAAAATAGIGLFIINQESLTRLRPMTDHYATAEALAAGIPGGIWFPFNPTVTLYSDGAYYHDGDGLFVRTLIGYPITLNQLRSHLPANFQAIAQGSATTNWNLVEAIAPPNAFQSQIGSWNVTAWAPENPEPSPPGTD